MIRNDWYVDYPINTYNVVVNLGNYTHFEDTCLNGQAPLALHFYCLSYNVPLAKKIFSQVKPMLHLYEQRFGPYPFPRDGFTLMEALYPMEHQGAVSIGPLNNPLNSTRFDSADLMKTMWHESAHEWWGNSVGCRDYADMWIHESFATYAEVLDLEFQQGRQAALNYLHSQAPQNKEPIISVYDVNHFHMGDMYPKGALMLHTLRNILDNDDKWFSILRNIQERFQYRTISSKVLTTYIGHLAGRDLSWFFDQYLRYPSPPVLLLQIKIVGTSLKINYKWQADRPGFCMPVKWTTSKDSFGFAYPTTDWQTMELKGMKRSDFKVDTDNFYFILKQTWNK
jgi:aminopeptidase N